MHHLFLCPRREGPISRTFTQCQALVRFFALRRIKPHTPPLVRAPVNSFEFQPCGRTPQAGVLIALTPAQEGSIPPTPSTHRLRLGLPGYLIPFRSPSFPRLSVRHRPESRLPPLVFFQISTHFTATLGIPLSSPTLKNYQFLSPHEVEPRTFKTDLISRLRALYAQ